MISSALALVLALGAPARAQAQTNEIQAYNDAKTAYDGGNYEEAIRRFGPLLDGGDRALTSRPLVQESRKYYGACLVLVGRSGDAVDVFKALLNDDPEEQLNESLFPTPVLDVFNQVKREMADELARRREAIRRQQERERHEAELRLRAELLSKVGVLERTVERRPLWQGLLPFGVAQFQNDQDTKGVLFLSGEALLLAVNVTSYFLWFSLPAVQQGEAPVNKTLEDVFGIANLTSLCGLGLLFGLGAWDGIANLDRETVVTRRRRMTPEEVEDAIRAGTTENEP